MTSARLNKKFSPSYKEKTTFFSLLLNIPMDVQITVLTFLTFSEMGGIMARVSKSFSQLTEQVEGCHYLTQCYKDSPQTVTLFKKESQKNGLQVLGKKLIPLEVAKNISSYSLSTLLKDSAVMALSEKLLTIEDIIQYKIDGAHLDSILVPNGLILLRKKYITPEDIMQLCCLKIVKLVRDNAMTALEAGELTIKEAKEMSSLHLRRKIEQISSKQSQPSTARLS